MEIVEKGVTKKEDVYTAKCTKCGCVYKYNTKEIKTRFTTKNGFDSSIHPWYTECPETSCINTNMHSPLNKI